jgi:hypothetical protein
MIKKRYIIAASIILLFALFPFFYRASDKENVFMGNNIVDRCGISGCPSEEFAGPDDKKQINENNDSFMLPAVDVFGLDPVGSYLLIRNEFIKIKNLNDLTAFSEMYGSPSNKRSVAELNKMKDIIDGKMVVSLLMSSIPEKISGAEIIWEKDGISSIRLTSEYGEKGEAKMMLEDGYWKFDNEKWGGI